MTIKEVTVALTEADIKKTESRPRRRTRKVGGQALETNQETSAPPTPEPSLSTSPNASSPSTTAPPQEQTPQIPITATTTANTQATLTSTTIATTTISAPPSASTSGGVHIKTRKRTNGSLLPPTPVPSHAARILPNKRHAMPSKDKPKLRVPFGGNANGVPTIPSILSNKNATNSVSNVATNVGTNAATNAATNSPSITVPPVTTGGVKKKRRFTERRIGISVKSLKNTRKARKSIRKQVASMSSVEIRKMLTEKGVLKGKSNPPEAMLRSLMKDYLALKQ